MSLLNSTWYASIIHLLLMKVVNKALSKYLNLRSIVLEILCCKDLVKNLYIVNSVISVILFSIVIILSLG